MRAEILHQSVEGDVEVIEQVSDRILDFLIRQRSTAFPLAGSSHGRHRRVGEFLDGRNDRARVLTDCISNEGVEFAGDFAEISSHSVEVDVEVVSRLDESVEAVVREIVSDEGRHLQIESAHRIDRQRVALTLSTIVRVISFSARFNDRKALPK